MRNKFFNLIDLILFCKISLLFFCYICIFQSCKYLQYSVFIKKKLSPFTIWSLSQKLYILFHTLFSTPLFLPINFKIWKKKIPSAWEHSHSWKMPRSKGGAEIKKTDIAVEGERASFDGNRSQKNYSTWVYILYAREYNAPGTCAFIERPFPRRVIFVCASVSAGFQSSIRIVIGSFPRRCAHLLTEVFSFSPVNFGHIFPA